MYRFGISTGSGDRIIISTVGFKPRKVNISNRRGQGTWTIGMRPGFMNKVTGNGFSVSLKGIVPIDGGFEILADEDLNVDGEEIVWTAYK